MQKTNNERTMAIAGFIGGILFSIGDLLVYLLPNCHDGKLIYDDWLKMSIMRPAMSTYLGCIGSVLLMVGFLSWYRLIKKGHSIIMKTCMLIVGSGVGITAIGHYIIACMAPLVYKSAMQAGVEQEKTLLLLKTLSNYMNPIQTYVILTVILLQSIIMIVMILKKNIQCPKWMILCNPLFMVTLSIPLSIVLNGTGFEGVMESFESIGEGILYIPILWHLSHHNYAGKIM